MQLVPILVTVFISAFIIGHTDALIRPLPFVKDKPWDFPGLGLIAIVIIFYLVGLLISNKAGQWIMDGANTVLSKIPVVKTIFGITEQATSILAADNTQRFNRVVLLEWPRDGMAAMGFVTGEARDPRDGRAMAVVYIPTIPNPTSGNLAFVNQDELYELDLSVEEAMKLVFSGGILMPETLSPMRLPEEYRDLVFNDFFRGNFERRSG